MPTDTRPNQTTSSNSTTATTENIDPELLAQLNSKKEMLVEAFTQVSNALRYAAKACDEFQLLVPRDVGIVSGDMAIGSGSNTTGFHNIHQHNQSIGNQRKFKKNQVKDPNAPKRPNTAYILFSNEIRSEIKAANPKANQKEIVTLIGQKWKALSREQKKVYEDRYFADKERYDEELRAYRATHGHESPASTSSNEDNGESSNNNNTLKTDSSSTFIPVQQQEVTSTSVVGGERIPSSETNISATTTSVATRLLDPQSTSTEQTEKTTTTTSTSEDNNNDDSKKRALPETHNDNDKNEGETIGGDRRRRRRGKGRW